MTEIKNYITTSGYAILREELHNLVTKERPQYVQLVNWAASNGDRSENADYQYGKKKLREIDKRIHSLTKCIEKSEVVDPTVHQGAETVFFGAIVEIIRNGSAEQVVKIVGQDEINPEQNHISWTSPLAKALIRKKLGDSFSFQAPQGIEEIEIVDINYE